MPRREFPCKSEISDETCCLAVIDWLEFHQDAFSPSESAPPLPNAKAALLLLQDDPSEDWLMPVLLVY